MKNTLYGRSILKIEDLTPKELEQVLDTAARLKKNRTSKALSGMHIALLFEKPSLRTRVSFEVAIRNLGGDVVTLTQDQIGLGVRESIADVARVLSRYVDAIVARTFSHSTVESMAQWASVPVINALSDVEHPCQALADLLTIREHKKKLSGLRVAFVGDGNNVAVSLAMACMMSGADFVIASPPNYLLPKDALTLIKKYAKATGANFMQTNSPMEAVERADVVYTDVWTSMGQEKESAARQKAFKGYCVDAKLIKSAKPAAIFMHDLPAHRGEEVTDEVMESAHSAVFDQAENRMHAQKALLLSVLSKTGV